MAARPEEVIWSSLVHFWKRILAALRSKQAVSVAVCHHGDLHVHHASELHSVEGRVMPANTLISESVRKRLKASGAPIPQTFAEQAVLFIQKAKSKRNPLKPKTIQTYEDRLKNDILPYIGKRPLELVDNVEVKSLVDKWAEKQVSRSTMKLNISVIKEIVNSATNPKGEKLYQVQWNPDFWDLPQGIAKKVTVDAQTVQDAVLKAVRHLSALIALLAGSGLRIQEAMGLRVGPGQGNESYWDERESKIVVCSQFDGKKDISTKTAAGCREVDLAPELNEYLKTRVSLTLPPIPGAAARNRMFAMSESWYDKEARKVGIKGFHSLRRFRSMYLDKMSCPRGLSRYWIGHAAGDVHEGYEQFGKEIETRKLEAQRVGLGFILPEGK